MLSAEKELIPAVTELSPESVVDASKRIAPFVHRTPLMQSHMLNKWLGHEIVFKVEGLQKMGAFKIRGAMNALLTLKEEGRLPKSIVAFSSGNHAQAVAYAGKMLGIETTVIMPAYVSKIKQQATISYGAHLMLTKNRQGAEAQAAEYQSRGAWLLHPSADDLVIAGQGTACLEALEDGADPDAIFATCGGGGLISGTLLAARAYVSKAEVWAAEPAIANDAARSVRTGSIVGFSESPMTIADGARTLHISDITFHYLRQLAGFYEIEESDIFYWTQWLQHLLKVSVEPTSAVAMAAAHQWLKSQSSPKRALVILSGGNIDAESNRRIWQQSYLEVTPAL